MCKENILKIADGRCKEFPFGAKILFVVSWVSFHQNYYLFYQILSNRSWFSCYKLNSEWVIKGNNSIYFLSATQNGNCQYRYWFQLSFLSPLPRKKILCLPCSISWKQMFLLFYLRTNLPWKKFQVQKQIVSQGYTMEYIGTSSSYLKAKKL